MEKLAVETLPPSLALALSNVLSPEECKEQIARAEAVGFDAAPVTTQLGMVMRPDIRNNTRVILDDTDTVASIWKRIQPWAPKRTGWTAIGLNERIRYYGYDPGEYFAPHRDGYFARSPQERSFFTLLIYLNDDYLGGETTILEKEWGEPIRIIPETGMALIFAHSLLHESTTLQHGRKYVLRSDIMYRKTQDSIQSPPPTV